MCLSCFFSTKPQTGVGSHQRRLTTPQQQKAKIFNVHFKSGVCGRGLYLQTVFWRSRLGVSHVATPLLPPLHVVP